MALRASVPMTNQKPDTATPRLLTRLVWELVKAEPFETLADLTDALKYRCAQLRIAWTPDAIREAYRLVASHTPLTVDPDVPARVPQPEIFSPSQDEARAILARLGVTVP
jgi:hypothetical protein